MWPITTSLVATKIVSRVEALVTFLQFWSIRYGVDYVFYQQGSQNRKIGCKFYFHDVLGFRHVSFRINLDAPPEPPFMQKALVKCLPAVRLGGRLAKPHPPRRVPLAAGQRRAQLNYLTRRCDFPRLAQDAHPDGRIGALSGRMACTAEGARAAHPETKLGPREDLE